MDIQYPRAMIIVGCLLAFLGFASLYVNRAPAPEPVQSNFQVDKEPPKGFDWEQAEDVDHWEIWVSEDNNPDNAELKATVTEPTATCEDVQVCGKDRYIHVRAVSGGKFSQFTTIHWPSLR